MLEIFLFLQTGGQKAHEHLKLRILVSDQQGAVPPSGPLSSLAVLFSEGARPEIPPHVAPGEWLAKGARDRAGRLSISE